MNIKERVLLCSITAGVAAAIITGVALLVFGIICVCSIRAHGAGEMDAYITSVSRIGDRVFIDAKDSQDSSNKYYSCVASADEQKFKDAIGKKVRLKWDGVFSLSPFWTECPAPVYIEEGNGS